jgi:hypothetical protein
MRARAFAGFEGDEALLARQCIMELARRYADLLPLCAAD